MTITTAMTMTMTMLMMMAMMMMIVFGIARERKAHACVYTSLYALGRMLCVYSSVCVRHEMGALSPSICLGTARGSDSGSYWPLDPANTSRRTSRLLTQMRFAKADCTLAQLPLQ